MRTTQRGRTFATMMDPQSRSYFVRRAEQERIAAQGAASEQVAQRHREMEERYRKLAIDEFQPRQETPEMVGGTLTGEFRVVP